MKNTKEGANARSPYSDRIIREILTNNPFGIERVYSLEDIHSFYFKRDKYSIIVGLIIAGKIEQLNDVENVSSNEKVQEFREYLDIMKFKDQHNKDYIITVYDSDMLEQDPAVIGIFKIS